MGVFAAVPELGLVVRVRRSKSCAWRHDFHHSWIVSFIYVRQPGAEVHRLTFDIQDCERASYQLDFLAGTSVRPGLCLPEDVHTLIQQETT